MDGLPCASFSITDGLEIFFLVKSHPIKSEKGGSKYEQND
jgi:hypothetical protein